MTQLVAYDIFEEGGVFSGQDIGWGNQDVPRVWGIYWGSQISLRRVAVV